MSTVKVIFNEDLLAYPDGFTRCSFIKGQEYEIDKDFGLKQIEAGICKPFEQRETKPAPIAMKKKRKSRIEK